MNGVRTAHNGSLIESDHRSLLTKPSFLVQIAQISLRNFRTLDSKEFSITNRGPFRSASRPSGPEGFLEPQVKFH